jgi:hypothetical protein
MKTTQIQVPLGRGASQIAAQVTGVKPIALSCSTISVQKGQIPVISVENPYEWNHFLSRLHKS